MPTTRRSRNRSRRESGLTDRLIGGAGEPRARALFCGDSHWQDVRATRDEPPPCRPSTTPSKRFARLWSSTLARPADDFEGLAPFEAMVAVFLDRALGGARWRAALDGLGEDGLLSPNVWPMPTSPRSPTPCARKVSPPPPGPSPRSNISLAGLSTSVARAACPWMTTTRAGCPRHSDWLREELAAIKGIGPATADAIVLFALKRPSYPVDRATLQGSGPSWLARFDGILRRGPRPPGRTGHERRGRARRTSGACTLVNLSHGMEQLGRQFCRAAAPRCEGCPLEHLLPEGGPREVDA